VGFRVAKDAIRLNLKAFVAAGREKTCLTDVDREDVHDYCRYYRYRCQYFLKLDFKQVPDFAESYEDLVELGEEIGFCPYYAQGALIAKADVTVQSYYRRRHAAKCIIVDEAHNLLVPRESSISIDLLNDAIYALEHCPLVHEETVKKLERLKQFVEEFQGVVDVGVF